MSFGVAGYSDYTKHKDDERKKKYIERHKKNKNWNRPETAGYLSRYILWNKPTLKESHGNLNENNKHIDLNYYDCLLDDKFLTSSRVLFTKRFNFIIQPELQP